MNTHSLVLSLPPVSPLEKIMEGEVCSSWGRSWKGETQDGMLQHVEQHNCLQNSIMILNYVIVDIIILKGLQIKY